MAHLQPTDTDDNRNKAKSYLLKVAVKRAVAHSQFALGSGLYVPHQLRQLRHLQYRRHIRR